MSIWMHDKTALISGGARGIGTRIASYFAMAGAKVMVTDVREVEGLARVEEIRRAGGDADFTPLDVRSESDWERAINVTVHRFGNLSTVVNNAGVEHSVPLADLSVEDFEHLMAVNIRGVALGMKHAMRAMRPGGAAGQGGSILNLSSMAHQRATSGAAVYAATNSAVERLTRIGAVEGGQSGWNIRVNCLYPGLIKTGMLTDLLARQVEMGSFANVGEVTADAIARTPLGRLGGVDDVANAALFMCSDLASFITGAGLAVDGGLGLT